VTAETTHDDEGEGKIGEEDHVASNGQGHSIT
jgi:hypothetical protein